MREKRIIYAACIIAKWEEEKKVWCLFYYLLYHISAIFMRL